MQISCDTPTYRLSNALNEALRSLNADNRVRDLLGTIETAERALAAAKLRVNPSAITAAPDEAAA